MWKDIKNKLWLPGFLLVETALVLVIIGIVFSSCISLMQTLTLYHKEYITQYNKRRIWHAISSYFARHGFLPPPIFIPCVISLAQKRVGVIPYLLLGLPKEVAKDGYGHWITYVVDENLTGLGLVHRKTICEVLYTRNPSIDLSSDETFSFNNSINKNKINKGHKDGIAVILISHGKEGRGAFTAHLDSRKPLLNTHGACKKRNCSDMMVYCLSPDTKDTMLNDDHVEWRTRSQICEEIGLSCFDYFFPPQQRKQYFSPHQRKQ